MVQIPMMFLGLNMLEISFKYGPGLFLCLLVWSIILLIYYRWRLRNQPEQSRRNTIVFATVAIVSLIGMITCDVMSHINGLNERLAYYEQNHLAKQGWTEKFDSYHLRSFDGGKNWYAVEWTKEEGLEIVGTAEELYPGLLKYLEGFDKLIEYVEEKGQLTLFGERAEKDKEVLEAAGFLVEQEEGK